MTKADIITEIAEKTGDWNQAVMEFGALQCIPNPSCETCVLAPYCEGFKSGNVESLPVKKNKTKQRKRFFNYLVYREGKYTYLVQRKHDDIWKSLYEFPMIESPGEITDVEKLNDFCSTEILKNKSIMASKQTIRHQLTHQTICATFWEIESSRVVVEKAWKKVHARTGFNLPVSRLIEKYIENKF